MELVYKILASKCNFKAKLDMASLLDILEDLVTEELKRVNCDNITLNDVYNCMWVYTKNKVKVLRSPDWGEELRVTCKSVKANKIINYMQTNFYDKDNNLVISGLTELCVLDKTNFKFVRLEKIGFTCENEDVDTSYNIENITEFDSKSEFKVAAYMLDSSMHINNVKSFVQFLNTLSIDELGSLIDDGYELLIKYASQGKYQNTLTVNKKVIDNKYYYSVNNGQTPVILGQINKL